MRTKKGGRAALSHANINGSTGRRPRATQSRHNAHALAWRLALPRLALAGGVAVAHLAGRLLHVRLEEPQLLVDPTRHFREEVGGAGITSLVGIVDVLADGVAIDGITVDQRREVIGDRIGVERIRGKLGLVGNGLDRAASGAAQLRDALGNLVVIVVDLGRGSRRASRECR